MTKPTLLTFEQYVRAASGKDIGELPATEVCALAQIMQWGAGPNQIVRLHGETFAQAVDRVNRQTP